MKIKLPVLTIAMTGLLSSVALMDTTTAADARSPRAVCDMRCAGNAMCLQECGQEQVMRRARKRTIIIIRIPRDEPPVAKSWVDGAFNPGTGGGGGGGGGGAR